MPRHAAPGFHCVVQPRSLLYTVATGRVVFWLCQSLEGFAAPYLRVPNTRVGWEGGSLMEVFTKLQLRIHAVCLNPSLHCLNLALIIPACGQHKALSWTYYWEHPLSTVTCFGVELSVQEKNDKCIAVSLLNWNRMQECVFSSAQTCTTGTIF